MHERGPLKDVLHQNSQLTELTNQWDTSKPVPVFYFKKNPPKLSYWDLLAHNDKRSGWSI
jgi:hypothetical protein